MLEIRQTDVFQTWMRKLRDLRANTVIVKRIERLSLGNFGDFKKIDSNVSELRIDYGPGYRIYYTQRGKEIVLLLIGGDKSTQKVDIQKAKTLLAQLETKND